MLWFNHSTDGPKKFEVLIGNGKQLWVNTYTLAPMETKAISINEIVEKQIPDSKGTVLSKDILSGQMGWWTHRAKWGKGRLMVSQPQSGLARSFSCGNCAGLCPVIGLDPQTFANLVIGNTGDLGNAQPQECLQTCGQCGGTPEGSTTETLTWSSSNTSIASLYSGQHSTMASFKGVAIGGAEGNVTATAGSCQGHGGGQITVCNEPNSASTSLVDPLNLSSVFPNLLSGIGNAAKVIVGPSGTIWNGQTITEVVTPGATNTCSAKFPQCSGSTTFTIDEGYQPCVKEGNNCVDVGPCSWVHQTHSSINTQ